ncbi:MAG TPA: LysE family translocator [Cytophagaceae bacterium]|jgi:threonine/homoserine/homoserine lactone efflux protein
MEFKIWLTYFITGFLVSVTPGPAVLLIASQGLRYGTGTSNFGAFGISSANLLYFILSAFGLGALIIEAENLFELIKITGAIYLVFIGVKMITASFKKDVVKKEVAEVKSKSLREAFVNAFVTQMSNPKAIIFFVALLPQFINPLGNILLQFCILAFSHIFMETLILMFYGWLSAIGASSVKDNKKVLGWVDRVGGGILIGIGMKLFFLKKLIKSQIAN